MAQDREHRVSLIDGTLSDIAARVRVYVRKNLKLLLSAVLPERRVSGRMEGNCTRSTSTRIEVIVAEVPLQPSRTAVPATEQEGPAFPCPPTTPAQVEDKLHPVQDGNADEHRIRHRGSLPS